MEEHRLQELNFLSRTKSPIPLTESRNNSVFDDTLYNDFYTIEELIEQGYLEYVGKDKSYQLYVRPLHNFSVYLMNNVIALKSGELVTLSLSQAGSQEFDVWLQNNRHQHS